MMFFIKDTLFDEPEPGRDVCRLHYAWTEPVKDAVVRDLTKKYGEQEVFSDFYRGRPITQIGHFDSGGMQHRDWKPVGIKIRDFNFSFYPHQLDFLLHGMKHALEDQRDGYRCKIHSWRYILCVTCEFAWRVQVELGERDAEIREQGRKNEEQLNEALKPVRDKGMLVPKETS